MRHFRSALLLMVLCTFFAYHTAYAALLPVGTSVRVSSQAAGAQTNIDLRFQMENGVSTVLDTISVTFASGFSLASITAADIDLLHGSAYEVHETIASTPAAGVWGAAVSGQTITLTPPTDVGASEIVDGALVAIRIGTNTAEGTQRITNPASAGRYEVKVGGGFEGFGTSIVTIVGASSGGFSVGFTVPAPTPTTAASGGGGGASAAAGPGAAGLTPPAVTPPTPPPTAADGTTPPSAADGTSPPATAADGASPGSAASTGSAASGGTAAGSAGTGTAASGGTGSAASGGSASAASSGGGGSAASGGSASTGGGGGGAGATTSPEVPTVVLPMIPTAPATSESATGTVPAPNLVTPATPTIPSANRQTLRWTIGELSMEAIPGKRLRVYPNESVMLRAEGIGQNAVAWVEFEGSRYTFSRDQFGIVATIRTDGALGVQRGEVVVQSSGEPERRTPIEVEVVPGFDIVLQEDGRTLPFSEGEVVLFQRVGTRWSSLGSVALGADGGFRRYVAGGKYRLDVKKDGWRTVRQEITAETGALSGRITLDRELVNPLAAVKEDATAAENVALVAQATADFVQQVVEQARTPEVQAVAEYAAPVAVVATVGATAAAASSFNILAYLRFLLTQPALLVRRRRREKWGLVYNAITKQPVDLAIVRLLDSATGAIKQTRITDAQGRFAFLSPAGAYRLQVVKPGFTFPSVALAGQTMDIELVDLYHGEPIEVQASATLTPNIPVDPVQATETPAAVIKRRRWRAFQHGLSVGSLGIAGIAYVLQPTTGMAIFGAVQVGMFFLFRRLAIPPKPKNWGIVYDGASRKPLSKAVVRVFDKKYNKLLETQVTDRDGKYAFFAGKNVYYVTAEVPGYERFVSSDIDLRKESLGVIREPLALVPKSS